jgi:hypothetical protein
MDIGTSLQLMIIDRGLYENSALSIHCYIEHRDNFSFDNFMFGIVIKTQPSFLVYFTEKNRIFTPN